MFRKELYIERFGNWKVTKVEFQYYFLGIKYKTVPINKPTI